MNEEIEWIRADQIAGRLGWDESNSYGQHVQLLSGLMGGRIAARADNGVTVRAKSVTRHTVERQEEEWENWDAIPRSLWRDYVYYLHLSGRKYEYDLKPSGKTKDGDWLTVRLTGLSFSESDILREMGPVKPLSSQGEAIATSERKGAGGSPVDSQKWANFAALLGAYAQCGGDIVPGEKAGALFSRVMDFGASLGLNEKDTPSIDTCRPALNRAMEMVEAAKNEGGVA